MPDANGNPLPWEISYGTAAPASPATVQAVPFPGAPPLPPLSNRMGRKTEVDTKATSDSDARAQGLYPGQLKEQQAKTDLANLQLRKERMAQGLDPDTGKPVNGAGKIGEDAIADMSPADQNIVKSIVQGRGPNISAFALGRNPALMRYIQAAYAYEPGTDLTALQRRQAAATKFLSNPNSPMLRVNQALQHLDRFYNTAHKLDNFGSGLIGSVGNYARAGEMAFAHDPRYTGFATDRDALATELAAAFAGSGQGGALADRNHWREVFSAAQSPESFDNAIREAAGLLGGRIEASTAQFKQAVGANADKFDLMSPAAKAAYDKFTADSFAAPTTGEKAIGNGQAPIKLPTGYQEAHEEFLANHPPGTLTPDEYVKFRKTLDEKYSFEGEQPIQSQLDPKAVKAFVDSYNAHKESSKVGVPTSTIPSNMIEQAATSPVGVGLAAFGNAATAGLPELLSGQEGRDAFHLAEEAHPVASTVGDIAGSIAPIGAAEAGFGRAARALGKGLENTTRDGVARAVAGNMLYQGARGFNDADTGEGTSGALEGAAEGAGGALAGKTVAEGVTPFLREGTQKALKALEGTDLTTAQRMGMGGSESMLSGVPGIHAAVGNAEKSMNINAANRVLKYIPSSVPGVAREVPKGIEAGTALNDFTHQQLAMGYNALKPQIGGMIDAPFKNAMAGLKAMADTPEKKAMFKEVESAVKLLDASKGAFDGNSYQAASTRLRTLIHNFATMEELHGSTAAGDMSQLAEKARKQVTALAARENPIVAPQLKSLDKGYAMQMRIDDASNRASATMGVWSPDQYATSIKKLEPNKQLFARGKSLDQDYAQAGQKIMGSTVSKKGSLRETGILGGGIAAAAYANPGAGAAIGGTIAAGYIPVVKRVVQAITTGKRPSTADIALVRSALTKAHLPPDLLDTSGRIALEHYLSSEGQK